MSYAPGRRFESCRGVSGWCDDVIEEFQVDGIINNAGVSVIDGAEFVSHEDFEWLMGINYQGSSTVPRPFCLIFGKGRMRTLLISPAYLV